MAAQEHMKEAIQSVIKIMMDRVMEKVLYEDPFNKDAFVAQKPLYAALVPEEIFKSSHFERRFVTPFGSVWEKLAVVAAKEGLGFGQAGFTIRGTVKEGRLQRISEILNRLEHAARGEKKTKPDWDSEMNYVLAGSGKDIPVTIVCDVYVEDRRKPRIKRYAFELKAPLPNSDQTKVSKEKMLKLYSMEPPQIDGAFYALPYNPFGRRQDYTWSFPARWFNMKKDQVVLIGDEFWEKVGGLGTYQSFISAVNEVGPEYRDRIYREYLGIEPPASSMPVKLL